MLDLAVLGWNALKLERVGRRLIGSYNPPVLLNFPEEYYNHFAQFALNIQPPWMYIYPALTNQFNFTLCDYTTNPSIQYSITPVNPGQKHFLANR
jgi:hypothetical protein